MRQLVRKLDDLVFDRRAIPRANGLDLPAVHWRAVYVFTNDTMCFVSRERDVARHLRIVMSYSLRAEAEWRGVFIPRCKVKRDQSIVRPSRRGGVPVLRRTTRKPMRRSDSPSNWDGGSPLRP